MAQRTWVQPALKHLGWVVRTADCLGCSKRFATIHPRAMCCSRRCTTKRNNAIQFAKYAAEHPTIPCVTCGEAFIRPRSDSRYCSMRCRRKDLYVPGPWAMHTKTCKWCGATFETHYSHTSYCSTTCTARYNYALNAEARRAYARRWVRANPEMARTHSATRFNGRRARMLDNPHSIGVPVVEWRRVLRRAAGRCFYCHEKRALTMEHVVPLSRGGRHAPGNIVAACAPCNYSKSDSLLIEWRVRQARTSRARAATG